MYVEGLLIINRLRRERGVKIFHYTTYPVCLGTPPAGGSGSPGTAWPPRRPTAPGAETSVPL